MKRIPVTIGVVLVVLAGSGAWMSWQHKDQQDRLKTAEVGRLADEEKARALSEAGQPAEHVRASGRRNDPPLDGAEAPHFTFSHFMDDRVGYEYGGQRRPPLYSHLVCADGVIQGMTFDYGWQKVDGPSYDFYKVPVATKGYDQICLSMRKEDVTTYKIIVSTRKPACDRTATGDSCELPLPAQECSDADRKAIRSLTGRDQDAVRWCQSQNAGERLGLLQAVTQRGKSCEINSWLVNGGKLWPMGEAYTGEFKVEDSQDKANCVFPLADGDFPEEDMTGNGGPMRPVLIFELGERTYIVQKSIGSEGFTSTLYRLNDKGLDEVVDYYNYTIARNFWRTTGEPDLKASDAEDSAP